MKSKQIYAVVVFKKKTSFGSGCTSICGYVTRSFLKARRNNRVRVFYGSDTWYPRRKDITVVIPIPYDIY